MVETISTAPRNLFLDLLRLHLGGLITVIERRKTVFSKQEDRVGEKKVKALEAAQLEFLSLLKWEKFSVNGF